MPHHHWQTRRSRGYCFVYFDSLKSAIRAVESSANLRIDSRYVRVDYSMTTRPRSPGYLDRHKDGYGVDHSRHRSQRNGRGHSPSSPRRKYTITLHLYAVTFFPSVSCTSQKVVNHDLTSITIVTDFIVFLSIHLFGFRTKMKAIIVDCCWYNRCDICPAHTQMHKKTYIVESSNLSIVHHQIKSTVGYRKPNIPTLMQQNARAHTHTPTNKHIHTCRNTSNQHVNLKWSNMNEIH